MSWVIETCLWFNKVKQESFLLWKTGLLRNVYCFRCCCCFVVVRFVICWHTNPMDDLRAKESPSISTSAGRRPIPLPCSVDGSYCTLVWLHTVYIERRYEKQHLILQYTYKEHAQSHMHTHATKYHFTPGNIYWGFRSVVFYCILTAHMRILQERAVTCFINGGKKRTTRSWSQAGTWIWQIDE